MITRLAWVTAAAARGRDDDEPLGLAALAAAGVDVEVVDWDDPTVDWARYDRVALRSTWDYPDRLDAFRAWLDAVEAVTELCNPGPIVRWNLDKRYLAALAADGVPCVPSTIVGPGEPVRLPEDAFVVKPTVGAGSRDVGVYPTGTTATAREHVARLHARGTAVLVQPLLRSVARDGERALVFLDGVFSHAATKRVALAEAGAVEGLFAAETLAPHEPDEEELVVARAAVAAARERLGPTAYGRVDLVRDDDRRPRVLELELVEPSLLLSQADPGAPGRLAAALAR